MNNLTTDDLVYLASPYSKSPVGPEEAYRMVQKVFYTLTHEGHIVFCPIVHCHDMAKTYNLPKEWPFWRRIDFKYIEACKALVVAKIPGWEESVGVTEEIAYANKLGIPVLDYEIEDAPETV